MFDVIAPRYDLVNRMMTFGLDLRWRRQAVRALGLPLGAQVLDLACGTGDFLALLDRAGLRPFGVDLSAGMLVANHAGSPLAQADGSRLPLADASVDGVTCGYALRNFTDLGAVFAELGRVVRPGGRISLLEVSEPERGPLLAGHRIWFHQAVPLIGGLISDAGAYRYLPKSTAYLPTTAGNSRRCSTPLDSRPSTAALCREASVSSSPPHARGSNDTPFGPGGGPVPLRSGSGFRPVRPGRCAWGRLHQRRSRPGGPRMRRLPPPAPRTRGAGRPREGRAGAWLPSPATTGSDGPSPAQRSVRSQAVRSWRSAPYPSTVRRRHRSRCLRSPWPSSRRVTRGSRWWPTNGRTCRPILKDCDPGWEPIRASRSGEARRPRPLYISRRSHPRIPPSRSRSWWTRLSWPSTVVSWPRSCWPARWR